MFLKKYSAKNTSISFGLMAFIVLNVALFIVLVCGVIYSVTSDQQLWLFFYVAAILISLLDVLIFYTLFTTNDQGNSQ